MISKVPPPDPPPKYYNPSNPRFKTTIFCNHHFIDITIKPCPKCLQLLDKLLKDYNILSDIEV